MHQRFTLFTLLFLIFALPNVGWGQDLTEAPDDPQIPDRVVNRQTGIWHGVYTKYQIGERLFYYGEYHVRRTDYYQNMRNLYLRFGVTYLLDKYLEVTGGFVNPYTWASDPEDTERFDPVVPEFRFWEQLLYVQSVGRVKFYHQLRFEQRWKRKNDIGADYKYSNRWRYRFTTYVPINDYTLRPGVLFGSFYNEIFIQNGKHIQYNNFEENRTVLGLGYILNNSLQFQAMYMWTYGQQSAFEFRQRDIIRFNIYHNLDLRRDR
ncbi:DUF2490 domain-containing protein [Tunicatimonas pelagia]|uniref:DUF2490 domain-containing protein n=1 Tax=Tunicatimonas pelagia TaxID=931531 RepID=UPI0026654B01|nr:DUF2490 domain-containing protein [Tunicatimonas pelagia]WKN45771.1 DUF2490 domain-containing protein [Tunicatimonas pelagia]